VPTESFVGSQILPQASPCTKGYSIAIDSKSDAKKKYLSS